MKDALDHLPERQQRELARIRSILLEEFDRAIHAGGGPTQSWRRDGKILKIILFGSYSRDDWVDAPETGYLSDFDILVIVSHEKLTEIANYWYVAEDKIERDPAIGRIVNVIVHTMAEVNSGLTQGQYFWTGVIKDGVELYALPGHPFATPKPLTPQEAADMAEKYQSEWLGKISEALAGAEFYAARQNVKDAAFLLHQAVERAYACFLLVHAFYFPRSHNIKFLRSQAETLDKALIAVWPREHRADRRRFEMLKRAYVEARYSDQYDLSAEDLAWLMDGAHRLRDLVEAACRNRLATLRREAGRD
ncbi:MULTISPECIES: HEPN domain-containing protein [Brevundimonas]|uniref:HEPN domain-containing protein n=1 Tax=Brevundimonas TaxID=41275 RepID=UPI001908D391|nr:MULTISPECIES: HEPN domain-containing protein [Brevundimonas]MBK1967832.1 HEPN domain-containing protein [Brevundimonas diminuta]